MPLTQPPFHHIKDSLNHKYAYLRCNLAEERPTITQPIAEKPVDVEICFSMHHSWSSLCRHFTKEHKLKLFEGIDMCSGCKHVFPCHFTAITHWLHKALSYQHTFLSNTEKPNFCESCLHWFDQIKQAYAHFNSEIKFDDPLSQKIQNRHINLGNAFAQPEEANKRSLVTPEDTIRFEESDQSDHMSDQSDTDDFIPYKIPSSGSCM